MTDPDKTVLGPTPPRPKSSPALEKFLTSLSVEPQDLSSDNLLAASPRAQISSLNVPAIGGIPLFARIGKGGMGAVYYGVHPRLKKEVAVKIMTLDANESPAAVEHFFREAQIAANLQSPNLISVLDVNEENSLCFIVMEFVSGMSSGAMVKRVIQTNKPGLDELSALEICIAATEGLAVAHDAEIVHRDIKPDNIMVPFDKNGHMLLNKSKLADLGLARSQGNDSNQSKSNDSICGTLGFMSPEQTRGSRFTKKPSDVFSMGATLYAMLTGCPPFIGDSPVSIILATVQNFPKPITKYRSDISANTLALIDRCLAKNDSERPANAAELLEAMRECRQHLAAPTRNSAIIERTVVKVQVKPKPDLDQDTILKTFKYTTPPMEKTTRSASATLAATPRTIKTGPPREATAKKPTEKSPLGLLSVAALGVIVIGVVGYFAFGGKKEEVKPKQPVAVLATTLTQNTVVTPSIVQKPVSATAVFDLDAFTIEVAKLPAVDQVPRVMEEMKKLNPLFDGNYNPVVIENNQVIELKFYIDNVITIAPIGALTTLKALLISGGVFRAKELIDFTPLARLKLNILDCRESKISDLSPLKNMPLTRLTISSNWELTDLSPISNLKLEHLDCGMTRVTSLVPLENMPLRRLAMQNSKVVDFTPLQKLPYLEELDIHATRISNLTPFKDLKISSLNIREIGDIDLAAIAKMRLMDVYLDYKSIKDISALKATTSLVRINRVPVAEFWKQYDAAPKVDVKTNEVLVSEDFEKFNLDQLPAHISVHNQSVFSVVEEPEHGKVLRFELKKAKTEETNLVFAMDIDAVKGKTVMVTLAAKVLEPFIQIGDENKSDKLAPHFSVVMRQGIDFLPRSEKTLPSDSKTWETYSLLTEIPGDATSSTVHIEGNFGAGVMLIDDLRVEIYDTKPRPFDLDAFAAEIAKLKPKEQYERVMSKIKEFNQGFNGTSRFLEYDGVLSHIYISADNLRDIRPLGAVPTIHYLQIGSKNPMSGDPTFISDISALAKLKLTGLTTGQNRISDLEPLRGMPLKILQLAYCKDLSEASIDVISTLKKLEELDLRGVSITDLKFTSGMSLRRLDIGGCVKIRDISPLANLKLKELVMYGVPVDDFLPILNMPLERIECKVTEQNIGLLKLIKTLKFVNRKPISELKVP